MTIGVAIYRIHDGDWRRGVLDHAFISVQGTLDTERGWIDTRGPEIAYGLSWVSELLIVDLGCEWPGHLVKVVWVLDPYTRDACAQMGLRLPTEIRVPLRPRDTGNHTPVDYKDFDDPWPRVDG